MLMAGGISNYPAVLAIAPIIAPSEKLSWLVGCSIIIVMRFLDDVFELGIKSRLFAQLVATLVTLAGMVRTQF